MKQIIVQPISCGPAAQIPTLQLIELFGEIAARNSMYRTKEQFTHYWECRKELEKRIGSDGLFVSQTKLSLKAAASDTEEFNEMMTYLGKITQAKTNGEAMGNLASYRHKLRERLMDQVIVHHALTEEYFNAIAGTLVKFLKVLPSVAASDAVKIALKQVSEVTERIVKNGTITPKLPDRPDRDTGS